MALRAPGGSVGTDPRTRCEEVRNQCVTPTRSALLRAEGPPTRSGDTLSSFEHGPRMRSASVALRLATWPVQLPAGRNRPTAWNIPPATATRRGRRDVRVLGCRSGTVDSCGPAGDVVDRQARHGDLRASPRGSSAGRRSRRPAGRPRPADRSGRRKPQSTSGAAGTVRRAPVKRSSSSTSPARTARSRIERRSMRTPHWARRTLAGARSPVRDSSLPAMWSWVISTARSPSSSARATAIGPPIGSKIAIVPSRARRAPARMAAMSSTTAPSPISYVAPAAAAAGALDDDLVGADGAPSEPSVGVDLSRTRRQPLDERRSRAGDRGDATEVVGALDDAHGVARAERPPAPPPARPRHRRPRRPREASPPAGTSRDPRSRARSSARRRT